MPRGKRVVLDSRTFGTRQDALAHFKAMLARYRPEDTVDDADARDLNSLLQRHPELAEKVGVGIHHFEVMSADYGTKCFAVVQRNGTRIDFSYVVCVNNAPNDE
jgi:hypothetical protein